MKIKTIMLEYQYFMGLFFLIDSFEFCIPFSAARANHVLTSTLYGYTIYSNVGLTLLFFW